MSAEQLFAEGRFDEAVEAAKSDVRKNPAAAKPRVFMFQLLCIQGQWERALTQLNVIGDLDAEMLPMVQTYREALRCEVLRADVFHGKRSPLIFGDPDQWIALLINALERGVAGEFDAAQALREQAFEQAPGSAGTIDGQAFQWLADADPRLGPVLEAIVSGRYYWVPYARIKSIRIEAPADLRDLVWLPAEFTWINGGQTVGLIPTRYPGSEQSGESDLMLARKTIWSEPHEGLFLGSGQRLLATEAAEYPLMDVRHIEFEVSETVVMPGPAKGSEDDG